MDKTNSKFAFDYCASPPWQQLLFLIGTGLFMMVGAAVVKTIILGSKFGISDTTVIFGCLFTFPLLLVHDPSDQQRCRQQAWVVWKGLCVYSLLLTLTFYTGLLPLKEGDGIAIFFPTIVLALVAIAMLRGWHILQNKRTSER